MLITTYGLSHLLLTLLESILPIPFPEKWNWSLGKVKLFDQVKTVTKMQRNDLKLQQSEAILHCAVLTCILRSLNRAIFWVLSFWAWNNNQLLFSIKVFKSLLKFSAWSSVSSYSSPWISWNTFPILSSWRTEDVPRAKHNLLHLQGTHSAGFILQNQTQKTHFIHFSIRHMTWRTLLESCVKVTGTLQFYQRFLIYLACLFIYCGHSWCSTNFIPGSQW